MGKMTMPKKWLKKTSIYVVLFALLTVPTLFSQSEFGVPNSRISAPPVQSFNNNNNDSSNSYHPLKSLPKTSISLLSQEITTSDSGGDKYNYLQKNIDHLKGQLGAGFYIAREGMFILATDSEKSKLINNTEITLNICKRNLVFNYFDAPVINPVTIFAFKDKESYRYNLKRIWHEKPISPYGHFNYVRKHIVFNLSTGVGTMVHELTHALMDPDMPRAPIWIAEGMATLFEHCVVDGYKIKGAINWRLPELLYKMNTEKYTPIEKLIKMSDSEFKIKESLNYAEARYLCMYFDEKGLLKKIYKSFRDNYRLDSTGKIFIEKAFNQKLPIIEQDWKRWVQTLHYQQDTMLSAR